MMNKLRAYVLGIASMTLLLAGSSKTAVFNIAHGANRATGTVSLNYPRPGIRLATPLESCGSACRSQQAGCENLLVSVCIAACSLPGASSATVNGGTAPYTFSVTDPNGAPVSTSSPSDDGFGRIRVTFTATSAGAYTATVTDARGCRVTCSDQAHLPVSVFSLTSQCVSTMCRATVFEGGALPFTFVATDPNGIPVVLSPLSSGRSVEFTATKAGAYTVTVIDSNGCQGTGTLQGVSCRSLSQSTWGKKKPKFNGEKRPKTVQRLFRDRFRDALNNKTLVVGVLGERSITFTEDSAGCVTQMLPASGSPTPLPAGLGDARVNPDTCQTSPSLPLAGDKLQNELLGQTIALALNAGGPFDNGGLTPDNGNAPALFHLVLCRTMITQAVLPGNDGILGSADDLADPGPDGVLGTQDDPKLTVTIPTSVLNAIAPGSILEALGKFTVVFQNGGSATVPPGNVGRLLMLANFALAGESNLGGASIVEINTAVDAINRAFDGCRFLVSCSNPIPCSYSLDRTTQSFTANGGTGTVNVTAPTGCTWSASSGASWITITSGSSGNGNGTVNYSVASNNTTSSRTGTLTVAGQNLIVTQSGTSSCSYSISPTSQSFGAGGGASSVSVMAATGCNWTASSGASWITITSGSSGSGNGTVFYSVAANSNNDSRIGTINVQGQILSITQSGQGGQPSEIAVDDAVFEDSIGLAQGGTDYVVNRLTPTSYPATLSEVAIFFPNSGGLNVGYPLTILAGTNTSGSPNIDGTIFQTFPSSVQALGQFNTYDVPDVTISSGDFVIGFRMTYSS